jgi:hypothetical protein
LSRDVAQESLGLGAFAIDVDADDHQPTVGVLRLHFVEPRKGVTAGLAPRCPEVEQHHLAAQVREVERVRRICSSSS